MRLIGAPESLVEFNEHIYLADQKINLDQFYIQWAQISGGTYVEKTPDYVTGDFYKIKGQIFTAITTSTAYQDVTITLEEYPMDSQGYPKAPINTEDYYFQIGAGWYESTPQHRSPEIVNPTFSVFTGSSPYVQTQLQPFTYGQEYFQRYRSFCGPQP